MTISSPQPSVLHLVTIFRQITSGEIRIPAFQRGFVWSEKQVLDLLDSVLQGYPIGSLLLWAVDKRTLKTAAPNATSFPVVPEQYPTSYVLDGMQRLSTLYGVFHYGVSTHDRLFEVYYDLDGRRFTRSDLGEISEAAFPLAALFIPRKLLEHQARLASRPDGDLLIEKLLALQAAFQDYMVPLVTIRSQDVSRIVGIFEKINSTGTRLDTVDFMRAITWADDFDLNDALEDAAAELAEVGFELEAETIVKCVGLVLGIAPTSEGLLEMRKRTPKELRAAFRTTLAGLKRTSEFLSSQLSIKSSSLVPYEGQLLLTFKTVGMQEAKPKDIPGIVQWFWATGFNEALRGKPDHYVVRAIDNWRGLIKGSIRGLEPRLRLTEADFAERRLVSRAALSSTFATMHAVNRARSLGTGDVINPDTYMSGSDLSGFAPVFALSELRGADHERLTSPRLFGNVVLLDEDALRIFGRENAKEAVLAAVNKGDWASLSSQFIDEECVKCLHDQDSQGFIDNRVRLMLAKATELVGEP